MSHVSEDACIAGERGGGWPSMDTLCNESEAIGVGEHTQKKAVQLDDEQQRTGTWSSRGLDSKSSPKKVENLSNRKVKVVTTAWGAMVVACNDGDRAM